MTEPQDSQSADVAEPTLARRLGPFDATMIVMGGIIGAGIFVNPSNVARDVHTPGLVLGAWIIGGAIALIGAFGGLAALGLVGLFIGPVVMAALLLVGQEWMTPAGRTPSEA